MQQWDTCYVTIVCEICTRSRRYSQHYIDAGDLLMICSGGLTDTFPPISDLTIDMPDPKRSAAKGERKGYHPLVNAGEGVAADQGGVEQVHRYRGMASREAVPPHCEGEG